MPDMRELIDLMEARRMASKPRLGRSERPSAPVAALDPMAAKAKLTETSRELAHTFDHLAWDMKWAKLLTERVKHEKTKYDAMIKAEMEDDPGSNSFGPFDYADNALRWASEIYNSMNRMDRPRGEIRGEVDDYQARKGQQLDDEAGFESDSHYIESSVFLSGMDLQKDLAGSLPWRLDAASLGTIPAALQTFVERWRGLPELEENGTEPLLVPSLLDMIECVVPFLLTVYAIMAKDAS